MSDTLGVGSGRPQATRDLGDYTIAGVAVRTTAGVDPADSQWGATPPPNGTLVLDNTNKIMWVRCQGTWSILSIFD